MPSKEKAHLWGQGRTVSSWPGTSYREDVPPRGRPSVDPVHTGEVTSTGCSGKRFMLTPRTWLERGRSELLPLHTVEWCYQLLKNGINGFKCLCWDSFWHYPLNVLKFKAILVLSFTRVVELFPSFSRLRNESPGTSLVLVHSNCVRAEMTNSSPAQQRGSAPQWEQPKNRLIYVQPHIRHYSH